MFNTWRQVVWCFFRCVVGDDGAGTKAWRICRGSTAPPLWTSPGRRRPAGGCDRLFSAFERCRRSRSSPGVSVTQFPRYVVRGQVYCAVGAVVELPRPGLWGRNEGAVHEDLVAGVDEPVEGIRRRRVQPSKTTRVAASGVSGTGSVLLQDLGAVPTDRARRQHRAINNKAKVLMYRLRSRCFSSFLPNTPVGIWSVSVPGLAVRGPVGIVW